MFAHEIAQMRLTGMTAALHICCDILYTGMQRAHVYIVHAPDLYFWASGQGRPKGKSPDHILWTAVFTLPGVKFAQHSWLVLNSCTALLVHSMPRNEFDFDRCDVNSVMEPDMQM